jgi:hypothetical protein
MRTTKITIMIESKREKVTLTEHGTVRIPLPNGNPNPHPDFESDSA